MPSACYKCNTLSPRGICQKCRKYTPLYGVYPACIYDGSAAKLVRSLKYRQDRSAAKAIAHIMNQRLPDFGHCVITNLPTASARIRQRSFDQSELIAKCLSEMRQIRFVKTLNRLGASRQVGATKELRSAQLKNAFWADFSDVKGKHVILVDDVITTGASVEVAARILKLSGAKKVIAVSFAHKKLG